MATKTAVIVLHNLEFFIWAIPPLSPQPPDFFDHYPTHIPPLFIIPIPEIELDSDDIGWNTMSSWYFGSSQPLYYCNPIQHSILQVILKPDLSAASLHVINDYEHTPDNLCFVANGDYWICEDTLVFTGTDLNPRANPYQSGVYTVSTSPRTIVNRISHGGPAAKMLLPGIGRKYVVFSCPSSGRFVRLDSSNLVAVLDFF
jgi:hypothetical protein